MKNKTKVKRCKEHEWYKYTHVNAYIGTHGVIERRYCFNCGLMQELIHKTWVTVHESVLGK